MTTECPSCDSHVHHVGIGLQALLSCEENSFDNLEDLLEYLDWYLGEISEE